MCLYLDNHSISTISENELVYLPTGDTDRPDRFLTMTELAAKNVLWQLLMLEVEPRVESWMKVVPAESTDLHKILFRQLRRR